MVRLFTGLLALAASIHSAAAIREIDFGACFGDAELTFGNNQYFIFWEKGGNDHTARPRCFAEAGKRDFAVGEIDEIVEYWSGNNEGTLTYEPGDGSMYEHHFPKHVTGKRSELTWRQAVSLEIK